jgi:hypothetical protein
VEVEVMVEVEVEVEEMAVPGKGLVLVPHWPCQQSL